MDFPKVKLMSFLSSLTPYLIIAILRLPLIKMTGETEELDIWGRKRYDKEISNIHLTAFKKSEDKDSPYVIVFVVINISRKNIQYEDFKNGTRFISIQIFISGSPLIIGYIKLKNKEEFTEIKNKLDETKEIIPNEMSEKEHLRNCPECTPDEKINEAKLKAWKALLDEKQLEIHYKNFNLNFFKKRCHINRTWLYLEALDDLRLDEAETTLTIDFDLSRAWEVRMYNYSKFGIRFKGYKQLYDSENYVYYMGGKEAANTFTRSLNIYTELNEQMVLKKPFITIQKILIILIIFGVSVGIAAYFYKYRSGNKMLIESFVGKENDK